MRVNIAMVYLDTQILESAEEANIFMLPTTIYLIFILLYILKSCSVSTQFVLHLHKTCAKYVMKANYNCFYFYFRVHHSYFQ